MSCGGAYRDLISHVVLPVDIAVNYARLLGFRNVTDTSWEDGIAVVRSTISGQKAYQALHVKVNHRYVVKRIFVEFREHTEKVAIFVTIRCSTGPSYRAMDRRQRSGSVRESDYGMRTNGPRQAGNKSRIDSEALRETLRLMLYYVSKMDCWFAQGAALVGVSIVLPCNILAPLRFHLDWKLSVTISNVCVRHWPKK